MKLVLSLKADHFIPVPFHQPSCAHILLSKAPLVSAPSEPLELVTPVEQAESASRPVPAFPTYRECHWLHAQALCGSADHRFRGGAAPNKCGNKPALARDTAHCSGTGIPAYATSSTPVSTIRHSDILKYRKELLNGETLYLANPRSNKQGRTVRTVNNNISLLCSLLRFAHKSGFISGKPFERYGSYTAQP